MGKDSFFNNKNKKLDHLITLHSKGIKNLNVRLKTIKIQN